MPNQKNGHSLTRFACVTHFLLIEPTDEAVPLLLGGGYGGGIVDARAESESGQTFIVFRVADSTGQLHECRCEPGTFAFLLILTCGGASLFIDRTEDRFYLKSFGQMKKSAGIIVGRLVVGAEEHEEVSCRNDDHLDLRHINVEVAGRRSKASRGPLDWVAEALATFPMIADKFIPGSREKKLRVGQQLLNLAWDRMDDERSLVLARGG